MNRFLPAALVVAAILLPPGDLFAQFTLTGSIAESIPGTGQVSSVVLDVKRVEPNGNTSFLMGASACEGAETVNCILPSGSFTLTNVPAGTYHLSPSSTTHGRTSVRADITGNTNIGSINMIRNPLSVFLFPIEVPSTGGTISVRIRAQRAWAIPDLPIQVRVIIEGHWTTRGDYAYQLPNPINVTWPAGLSDSGVVEIGSFEVLGNEPAGTFYCAMVQISVQGQPEFVLANPGTCAGKRP